MIVTYDRQNIFIVQATGIYKNRDAPSATYIVPKQ